MAVDNETLLWDYLVSKGLTQEAVAGIMGNIHAESACNPINLQNTANQRLNMTDEQYTHAVDDGTYTNFVYDSAGYGLCQWTYWSRKQSLLKAAKGSLTSIGDIYLQADFLLSELKSYGILKRIKTSKDVYEVTKIILVEFEKPRSVINKPQEEVEKVAQKRYNYSSTIYNRHYNSLEDDLATLAKFNVINSPDYWRNNADSLKYLRVLYHNMARVLKMYEGS